MLKTLIFPCLLPFLLAGCDVKDDPELPRQLAETKVNIEELEAEMEAVEAEIKASRIPDPSEQLDPLTLEAEAAAARKVALEKEVRELGEAREKAVEELEAYKEKYRLR
jgi:chromosome segregation ATPase